VLGISVYAAKGQPQAQQTTDETECLAWAEQQTGIKLPPPAVADTVQAKKGLRRRHNEKEAKKANEQAEAKRQEQVTTLKKSMTSCLQGRGYTVN